MLFPGVSCSNQVCERWVQPWSTPESALHEGTQAAVGACFFSVPMVLEVQSCGGGKKTPGWHLCSGLNKNGCCTVRHLSTQDVLQRCTSVERGSEPAKNLVLFHETPHRGNDSQRHALPLLKRPDHQCSTAVVRTIHGTHVGDRFKKTPCTLPGTPNQTRNPS